VPKLSGLLTGGGHGDAQALERVQGQAFSGLAIGAGALVYRALIVKGKESLDLTDDPATRAVWFEDLIQETKESATQAIDALPTIGAIIGLGKQAGRQQGSEERFQVTEALLTEVSDPAAQGGQAGTEGGKEGRVHDKYIYLSMA
jgi:hypothetical protein